MGISRNLLVVENASPGAQADHVIVQAAVDPFRPVYCVWNTGVYCSDAPRPACLFQSLPFTLQVQHLRATSQISEN